MNSLQNHRPGRLSPNRLAPYQTVGVGMLFTLFVLLIPGLLEATVFPARTIEQITMVHLIRGLIAAITGMFFIWWIMHRKEVELINLRDHFREQLQTRTMQLDEAVREGSRKISDLEELQRALTDQRKDFLLALQLRLKTPVRANVIAVNDLIRGEYGEMTAMQKDVLLLMAENNLDIERLVSMLVSLYRYRNAEFILNRTSCTLEDLFPAFPDLQERAKRRNVSIENTLSRGLICECDPEEMRRLLHHLLDNAIKHATSTVNLSSNITEKYLEIVVADDGQGIARPELERLFDRFHYVTATGTYAPVTGIGLCLCAEIAKAHGGSLICRSLPGEGADFILRIPRTNSTSL